MLRYLLGDARGVEENEFDAEPAFGMGMKIVVHPVEHSKERVQVLVPPSEGEGRAGIPQVVIASAASSTRLQLWKRTMFEAPYPPYDPLDKSG